jgi:hypothetical protein
MTYETLPTGEETVTVPSRITYDMFGANPKFFREHIEGKSLKVAGYFGKFTYIIAGPKGKQETFGIHEDDLEPDEKLAERKEIARAKRAKLAAHINE